MKISEMQEICNTAQEFGRGCIGCKLFTPLIKKGCLKNHRFEISKEYQKAKLENNEVLAEKIMKDYQELERKVLNK